MYIHKQSAKLAPEASSNNAGEDIIDLYYIQDIRDMCQNICRGVCLTEAAVLTTPSFAHAYPPFPKKTAMWSCTCFSMSPSVHAA